MINKTPYNAEKSRIRSNSKHEKNHIPSKSPVTESSDTCFRQRRPVGQPPVSTDGLALWMKCIKQAADITISINSKTNVI